MLLTGGRSASSTRPPHSPAACHPVDRRPRRRTRRHQRTSPSQEPAAVLPARRHGRIGADADVTFALTTGRHPRDRPGRPPGPTDLAIRSPARRARCRQQLLQVYARGLALDADLDGSPQATKITSFIELIAAVQLAPHRVTRVSRWIGPGAGRDRQSRHHADPRAPRRGHNEVSGRTAEKGRRCGCCRLRPAGPPAVPRRPRRRACCARSTCTRRARTSPAPGRARASCGGGGRGIIKAVRIHRRSASFHHRLRFARATWHIDFVYHLSRISHGTGRSHRFRRPVRHRRWAIPARCIGRQGAPGRTRSSQGLSPSCRST